MFTSVVVVLLLTTLSVADDSSQAPQHPFRVVCHMTLYDGYPFTALDAEAALPTCTHLVYNYILFNGSSFTVYSSNPTRDFGNTGIKGMVAFKNKFPYLKTMIRVGGTKVEAPYYYQMVSKQETRKTFVDSVLKFLFDHGLDGVDLGWYTPETFPRGKPSFVELVKDLRKQFDKLNLILSLTLAGFEKRVFWGVDPTVLGEHVHFLNLLTFYQPYNTQVRARSPSRSTDNVEYWATLNLYKQSGVPPFKMNFGISNYGLFYTLADEDRTGNVVGMPFRDFCRKDIRLLCKWKEEVGGVVEEWDNYSETPFSRKKDQVVSHENARSIGIKVKDAIVRWGLGGIAIFDLNQDDYKGDCTASGGKYPMLRNIEKSLISITERVYADIFKSTENYNARYFWNGENQTIWSEDEKYLGWDKN